MGNILTTSKTSKYLKKSLNYLLIILFEILFTTYALAKSKDTIITETENYKIIHYYNWEPWDDFIKFQRIMRNKPLTDSNIYARLIIINKKNNDTTNLPSIALTTLKVYEDKNLIVGLSSIYLFNQYNIIIWSIDGKIWFKRRFDPYEIKLNKKEYKYFKSQFPEEHERLLKTDHIYREDNKIYIGNLGSINLKNDKLLNKFMNDHGVINHYFPRITSDTAGMISNHYNLNNPVYDIIIKNGIPIKIILNREDGKLVHIPINYNGL